MSKTHVEADATQDQAVAYAYNADDQLLVEVADGADPYTLLYGHYVGSAFQKGYDANGSLTEQHKDTNGNAVEDDSYGWDLRGRMVSATSTTFSGGTPATTTTAYSYDHDGVRVSETTRAGTAQASTIAFLNDKQNPTGYAKSVEERVAGHVQRRYVLGSKVEGQRDAANGMLYLLTDGHGSTRALVDLAGNVVEREDYDAFGTVVAGTIGAATISKTSWLFGGDGVYDPSTGWTYNLARWRDGFRFVSYDNFEADPSSPANLHKYVYGASNPITSHDPSGYNSLAETETVTGNLTQLARLTLDALNGIQRVKHWVNFLWDFSKVYSALTGGDLAAVLKDSFAATRNEVFRKLGFEGIIGDLEDNLPRIERDVLPYWASAIVAHYRQIDRLLIYLPVPFPMPTFELNSKLEIPGLNMPIMLVFGAGGKKAGRITGIGVGLTGGAREQIFRMDFHPTHEDPQDLDYWDSLPFHYHVSGWNNPG